MFGSALKVIGPSVLVLASAASDSAAKQQLKNALAPLASTLGTIWTATAAEDSVS